MSGGKNYSGPLGDWLAKPDIVRILIFACLVGVSSLVFPFFPMHDLLYAYSFTHLPLS